MILIWTGIIALYDVFDSIRTPKNQLSAMRQRLEYVIILFRYINGTIMNIQLLHHNLYFFANIKRFSSENLFYYGWVLSVLNSDSVWMSFSVLMRSLPELGITTVDLLIRASLLFTRVSMSFRFLIWSAV